MKNTRLLALLLALLTLSACGKTDVQNETSPAETDPTVPETVETEAETNLPDMDWGGREFRVLGYKCEQYNQFSTFEVDAEGETGEVVNDAIFRRNTAIEDKYGVVITEYTDGSNDEFWSSPYPHLKTTILAGEDLYDLCFLSLRTIGTAARENQLIDMNSIAYIDFSQDYWSADRNDALSIGGKLYFTSSDFSLRDKNRAYILAYNKDMFTDLALGDPIQTVKDGLWTLDLMREWAELAARDLDGNGTVDFTDAFGYGSDSTNSIYPMVYACGVQALGKDADGTPTLTLNNEHTVDALEKVLALYGNTSVTLECEDWSGKTGTIDHNSVACNAFYEGRELFNASFLHSLSGYSEKCENDYGILPYPKYDTEQDKYYSYADIFSMLFAVPISCAEPDFAGFMLEALSAASTDTSLQAYYEISCKMKYTYDEDSAEMLDLICSNLQFDLSRIYEISGVSDLLKNIAYDKTNTFASRYAKIEQKALSDIDVLVEDLQ